MNCFLRAASLLIPTILFRYTTKSFGPMMAKAAKLAIVEAENIVEVGSIDPNDVDLPGIFIDRIVPATVDSQPEILKTRSDNSGKDSAKVVSEAQQRRDRIARRAAKELKHGSYVNLGVGRDYKPRAAATGQRPFADLIFNRYSNSCTILLATRRASLDSVREWNPGNG